MCSKKFNWTILLMCDPVTSHKPFFAFFRNRQKRAEVPDYQLSCCSVGIFLYFFFFETGE